MSEVNESEAEAKKPSQRTLTGTVVSNKMDKTIAVEIERLIKHARYGKYIRRTTKLLAHDENNGMPAKATPSSIAPCRRCRAASPGKLVRVVERAPAE